MKNLENKVKKKEGQQKGNEKQKSKSVAERTKIENAIITKAICLLATTNYIIINST